MLRLDNSRMTKQVDLGYPPKNLKNVTVLLDIGKNRYTIEKTALNRQQYASFAAKRIDHIKEWEQQKAEKINYITRNRRIPNNIVTNCLICGRKCKNIKNITNLKVFITKMHQKTGKKDKSVNNDCNIRHRDCNH